MDESSVKLYSIRRNYMTDARSRHAKTAYKIDDLDGVQYGIRMLMTAMVRLESNADSERRVTDKGLFEDVAVWMEFILLRFEMHTGDEGDYGYQEYAAELSDAEREQFLRARQLRRRHIQHLSAKWLRESTFVLDAVDAVEGKTTKLLLDFRMEGPDGEVTYFKHEYEIPHEKQMCYPFFALMELSRGCLNWEVFSSGVDKVIGFLQRDLRKLQAKMIAEINGLSRSERKSILMSIN